MTWIFIKGGISKDDRDFPDYELIRLNMGYTRRYAKKMDLIRMKPFSAIPSTNYCLAKPRAAEY